MGLDFYIIAEITKRFKVRYLDEYMFVYRPTAGSITKLEAGNITKQFNQVLGLYNSDYPALVKKGLQRGGRILLYNQVEDKPSLKNLLLLFKNFEFSLLHQKQILKWFYLQLKIIFRLNAIGANR